MVHHMLELCCANCLLSLGYVIGLVGGPLDKQAHTTLIFNDKAYALMSGAGAGISSGC